MKSCPLCLARRLALAALCILLASAAVAQPDPAALEEAWKALPEYRFGQDRSRLTLLSDAVVFALEKGDAAARATLAAKLVGVLDDAEATGDAKRFACEQLTVIGGAEAVPALAALLSDAQLWDAGLFALARIPGPEAGAALRAALTSTDGAPRIGVIGVLGDRRDAEALPALARLAGADDAPTAEAALLALARVGGEAAARALAPLVSPPSGAPPPAVVEAALRLGDQLRREGNTEAAAGLYRRVFTSRSSVDLRAAGLRGLARSLGMGALADLERAYESGDSTLQRAAAEELPRLPGWRADAAFTNRLTAAPPELQLVFLAGLAERGGRDAVPAITRLTDSEHPEVRTTALAALGRLGDTDSVPLLIAALQDAAPAVRQAARAALVRLPAEKGNDAILARASAAPPQTRAELLGVLAERAATDKTAELFKLTGDDPDPAVRVAALKSLSTLLPPERASELLPRLAAIEDEEERDAMTEALVGLLRGREDTEARVAALLESYPAMRPAAQAALLRILGRLGGEASFSFVHARRADANPTLVDAAVRALADWPDPRPLDALLAIARESDRATHKVLALRGYLRILSEWRGASPEELLTRYQAALETAGRDEEKKLALAGLARVSSPAALELIRPHLDSPALVGDAEVAALSVVGQLRPDDQRAARALVESIAEKTADERTRNNARALLRRMR